MSSEAVSFKNAQGERLDARLEQPAGQEPVAYALFAHCFTCSKDLRAARGLSRTLTREGMAVLRFDFTGIGESEGDFAGTNFSSNVADLVEAAKYLEQAHEAPALLVGHSLGGAAVLQAVAEIDSVQAVATIAAPADPAHVKHLVADSVDEIKNKGYAHVQLAGRSFTIKKQFLDDLEGATTEERISTMDFPLLLFHSPTDQVVGIENARRLYEAARHPKSFISLDKADHLLTSEEDQAFVGTVLGAWARRYIGAMPQTAPPQNTLMCETSDHDSAVTRTLSEGFRTDILAGGHPLVADEPESAGGTDEGPDPYDLLAASLGACTSMTLRMYAERKGWPLEKVIVRLNHEKVHAEDCAHCETEVGKIDQLVRKLYVYGPLSDEQRQRLTDIADRCPVHQTLHSEIEVQTRLVDEEA